MKRNWLPAALLAMLVGIMGCQTETPLGPVEREGIIKNHGPVKIGVTLPLSGEFHEYGERILTGIEMAVRELNYRRGVSGRQVELLVLDNRGNPDLAADQVDEFSREEVSALLAGHSTWDVSMIGERAKALRLPVMLPMATGNELVEGNPYLSRVVFSNSDQAKVLAGYAWFWRKLMRLGVIVNMGPGGAYSREIGRETAEAFEGYGGNVVRMEELHPDSDLDAVLRDLLAASPQGIVIPEETALSAKIFKRLRELGFQGIFFGPDTWDEIEFLHHCGDRPGDAFYIGFYSPDYKSDTAQTFRENFRKAYHYDPGSCEAQGYDAMKILAIGLEDARTLEQYQKNLATIRSYPGASGTYTLRPDGSVDRTIHINTIRPPGRGNPEPAARLNRSFMTSQISRLDN